MDLQQFQDDMMAGVIACGKSRMEKTHGNSMPLLFPSQEVRQVDKVSTTSRDSHSKPNVLRMSTSSQNNPD